MSRVIKELEANHLSGEKLEKKDPQKILIYFCHYLDPQHIFLKKEDIDDFVEKYSSHLIGDLRNEDLTFAKEIYDILLQRYQDFEFMFSRTSLLIVLN